MKVIARIALMVAIGACSEGTAPELENLCGASGPSITPTAATLAVGDTLRFQVGPMTNFCTGKGPFPPVFSSSNAAIVSVDAVSGLVTARAIGVASVVATSSGDPSWAVAAGVQVK